MKRIILILLIFNTLNLSSQDWGNIHENWETAKEIAQNEDKNILIILTGTEWCRPCIKLKRKIFSKEEFKELVGSKYVTYLLELPVVKNATKKRGVTIIYNDPKYNQYEDMKEEYNANGLPSLLITDSNGALISQINGNLNSIDNIMTQL